MKNIFMAAMVAASALVFAQDASASACNMYACASLITIDSGSAYSCSYTGSQCSCTDLAADIGAPKRIQVSSPGPQWTNYGSIVGSSSNCWIGDGLIAPSEDIQASKEAPLSDVFSPSQSTAYYGYVGATLRSPSTGRTTSAKARLDACLFYTDVDNLGTGFTGWDTCKNNTTYGCNAANKNEYCMNNGASVCEDRCDCVFTGFSSCENL